MVKNSSQTKIKKYKDYLSNCLDVYMEISKKLNNILDSPLEDLFSLEEKTNNTINNKEEDYPLFYSHLNKKQVNSLIELINRESHLKKDISHFLLSNKPINKGDIGIFYAFSKDNIISVVYHEDQINTNTFLDSFGHNFMWETTLFFSTLFDNLTFYEKIYLLNEYALVPRGRIISFKDKNKTNVLMDHHITKDKKYLLNHFGLQKKKNINVMKDDHYRTYNERDKYSLLEIFNKIENFDYVKKILSYK